MERVTDPADPRRCRGAAPDGQCQNVAEPGAEYCRAHGGHDNTDQQSLRGYLLAKARDRARLAELSDELEPIKELRDSIALLHMLIERRFNLVKDETDLLAACGPLNQMLQNMDRLVNSCHKIEQNLGQLLAKHAVLILAKRMVEIIVEELEGIENYELIVDRITERLIDTIRGAGNMEQEPSAVGLPPPEDCPAQG
jgi:hypothetical protein